MRIIFVRHGHPDYKTDSLTELGHRQAEAAAHQLAWRGISEIYSSSCGRAVQTAEHTAALLGLPVTQLDFMREVKWGKDGQTPGEHEKYHPWNCAYALAASGADMVRYDYDSLPTYHDTRFEECFHFVSRSFDEWLAGFGYERDGLIYRCTRENDRTIALFSHGGASSCVFAHLLNLPPMYLCACFPIGFTSFTVFDFRGEAGGPAVPVLSVFNEHAHIEDGCPNHYEM